MDCAPLPVKSTVLVVAFKVPPFCVQFPSTVNDPVVALNVPPSIVIPPAPMAQACAGAAPENPSAVHTIPSAVIVCPATRLPEVFVKVPATLSAPPRVSSPPLCCISPYVTPGPVRVVLEPVSYKNLEVASRVNVAPVKSQVPPDTFVTLPAFIVSVLPSEMVKSSPPVSSESSIAAVRLNVVAPPLQKRASNLPDVNVPETICAPPSK